MIGGGGATAQPLQFAGEYGNIDLTINATEAPCDDPDQPKGTDRATAEYLMKKYYEYRGGELA